MLIGQSPFAGDDEDDLFASICKDRVYFPKWISEAAISVLNGVSIFFPQFFVIFVAAIQRLISKDKYDPFCYTLVKLDSE